MSYTTVHLYYDDVQVGQEWESLGRTVTEADIVNFAGISGDFNPIHVDHEFCKTTVFRRPIAHGMLILAMGSGLGLLCPPIRTLAFMGIKEWKFLEPVYMGDTIRVRTKILQKEERSRGKRGVITWQRWVINQHNKVVEEGIMVTLVEGRARRSANQTSNGQEPGVRGQESEATDQESSKGT